MDDVTRFVIGVDSDGVATATSRMGKMVTQGEILQGCLEHLGVASKKVSTETATMGGELTSATSATAGFISKMIILTGLFEAIKELKQGVDTIKEFGAEMSRVGLVTGASAVDIHNLTEAALALGPAAGKGPVEAAQAMQILGKEGYNTNQIIAAMPDIANLATVANMGMGETAYTVTNILDGFNLTAEDTHRLTEMLAEASLKTKVPLDTLANGLRNVAPIAGQMKGGLEEAIAAMVELDNAGMGKGGGGGGGGAMLLPNIIAAFDKTGNGIEKLKTTLSSFGLDIDKVDPLLIGFNGLINEMGKAGVTSTALMTAFGSKVGSALTDLIAKREGLNELTKGITGTGTSLADMAAKVQDNLAGDWSKLIANIQDLTVRVGNDGLSGALRTGVQDISKFIDELNLLSETGTFRTGFELIKDEVNELGDTFKLLSVDTHGYFSNFGTDALHAMANIKALIEFADNWRDSSKSSLNNWRDSMKDALGNVGVFWHDYFVGLQGNAHDLERAGADYATNEQARADAWVARKKEIQDLYEKNFKIIDENNSIENQQADAKVKAINDEIAALKARNVLLATPFGAWTLGQNNADVIKPKTAAGNTGTTPDDPKQLTATEQGKYDQLLAAQQKSDTEILAEVTKSFDDQNAIIEKQYAWRVAAAQKSFATSKKMFFDAVGDEMSEIKSAYIQEQTLTATNTQQKSVAIMKGEQQQAAMAKTQYEADLNNLTNADGKLKNTDTSYQAQSLVLWQQYQTKLTSLGTVGQQIMEQQQAEVQTKILGMTATLVDAIASETEKGTAAYKVAFVAQKAIAIAQAIINTNLAATQALTLGPILGIPAATAVEILGYANVAMIAAQAIQGFEYGGMIPAGSVGMVGEAGPEFVQGPALVTSARQTAAMTAAQSPTKLNVVVHNYGNNRIQTKTSDGPNGRTMEMFIRQADDRMAKNVETGGNKFTKSLEKRYNLKRGQ